MTYLYITPAVTYKEKFNLVNFVETGTSNGDGIVYANSIGFNPDNIFSCDLDQEAIKIAEARLPKSNLFIGDSLSFLKELLPNLSNPTLFWLDAHFPSYYGMKEIDEITKMPMVEELKLIKFLKKDFYKDVIFCDDMRIFADKRNPAYTEKEIPEYFYSYNLWDEFTEILKDTHYLSQIQIMEGIGIFYPK